ncbi:unnamed protein product, partial [Prorocentrum cordatum]
MAKNSGDDIVPKWNGDPTTVDDYERDVKAYIRGTRRDERYVCGPRLWRRLEGRARQATKDVNWDRIEKDDGATELLRHVRAKLGAQPIQDAGKYLAIWIFDLRRDTGEPMPSYISRDDAAYHDGVKGFDTKYFKKQRTTRLSARAKKWNNLYGELNWFLYKIEQEGPEDAAEKAKELNHSLWDFVKTGLQEIPEHPEFGTDFNQAMPLDQLRGWLLLQRSRLTPTERAAVISAFKGNFDYDRIGEQLRVSWPDDELTSRDKKQGKDFRHRDRGRIHAGWEANCEEDDDYSYYEEHESEATYDSQGDEEDEEDPEEPLYSAQEIEEAETAFAAQQRSFEEDPRLDLEAQGHPRGEAAGADSDVTDHPDEKEIAPKDAEMEANLITNEMSRLRLEASLANKPVIKDRPKTANQKKQLDKNSYMPIEGAIELRERVKHEKLPIWSTLEKAEDWILRSVKQSSSKGSGILDIGATSSIMGIEAAENLRDIIYEQTGKNIKMDVSQQSTFIFGDGNARTCTGKATFPLMIAGVDGELEINILDADAPLLIGVDVLSRIGAAIDCEAHAVYFKKLGRRAELLVLPSGPRQWSPTSLRYIIMTYDYGYIIITYDHGDIIITWDHGDIIITYDYRDIILTNVMDIIRIVPYSTYYDIIRNTYRDSRNQHFFHIRMSLNREAKCRKAESQQVKLENEEMVGSWEAVPPLDAGAPTRPPTSTRPTQPMPPSARLIQHQDTRGNIFCTVECSELDKSLKRLSDTFLLEHLPTWEMWSSKLLKQWTMCRRWGRVIIKVFLKTIDRVTWKLDSIGLPVQLLPEKYPTWPAELGHRAKIEPQRPRTETKQRSAASAAAREQNQELRANIETAKSDFSTKFATVDAFAALSSEQIYEKLNMVTVVNHLKPLCKTWGLTQSGKKEVIDRLIAHIIEQRGTAAATIRVKRGPETKKVETGPIVVGQAIPAHYTQMCQHPDCQQQRGIAKNEPIVKGYHKAKFLLDERRPELLVSTPPCGPWSIMQNINQRDDKQKENLRKKRLKSQRIFENNKWLIEHQVLHLNGSALVDQPHNSRSWQKTCWKDLHNILPYEVIVDGCVCGLKAPDTGELMKKRWKFLTNDKRIWVALQPLQCRGGHYHEEIESSLRTEASGSYPKMLRRRILRDLTKSQNQNYFEEEVVNFCMAATQQPPTEPTPEEDETSIPPLDGKESRDLTSDTVKMLESCIKLVHTHLGHLPRAHLLRYLRDRGARPEVLRLARTFKCDICDAHRPPTKRPPASSAEQPQNCHEVLFDAFSWIRRSTNTNVMALAILDAGSDILYVRLIDEKAIPETCRQVRAGDLRRIFATKWFTWMGRPKVMRYDPAGSAISDEFRERIESQGVYCLPCAADAHWQIGKIERAIEAFKEALDAFDEMTQLKFPREPGARKDNPDPCQGEAAGTDLDEYSAMGLPAQDIDLEAMASLRSRREQPGTWTFGDVQKQLDTNEVIDLSNESPPSGEDLAADDGESVSARTFENNARSTEPPIKKQRINLATQEDYSYYLQEANFYGDYAYSVQPYDEVKEDDELIVLDIPVHKEHMFMAYMDDPSNFVASQARKGRVEVSFKKATPEEKKLLLEAQQKECTSVLSTKAVRILSRQGIDPTRLLRCRFVLTWKKGDKGNALRGKARLVVLGFSDPDLLHLRTESPVASRRARQLLLAMAARHKWKLEKADAVTAFLQGETDEEKRKIYADPPKDVRQAFGMKDDEVLQFLKPMYGFVHAPRKWWLHFKETLKMLQLEVIQCEPCVWAIRDSTTLVGTDSYSLNVEPIKIRRGRKPTDGVSDKERSDLRGRLGAVGWRAQQSATWLSAEVALLQAEIPTATVSTIQKINKLIRTRNDTADVVMLIPAIEHIAVVGWGDAAWAARITGESQGGEMIVLAPLSFLSGSTETVAPISWRSCKLPRVARSSTSAEVQRMTETLDEISYVRLFIYELECGQVDYTNKQHVNDAISSCPGVLVTDGKSGYDAIEKSESAGLGLRDKRTSIECLGIRQQKEQTALQIRWVHSDAMLADGLTKDRAAKVLLEFFRTGQRWRLVDDPLHRSARKRKTEGMDKLDHGKPLFTNDDEAMLEALIYYARDNPDKQ